MHNQCDEGVATTLATGGMLLCGKPALGGRCRKRSGLAGKSANIRAKLQHDIVMSKSFDNAGGLRSSPRNLLLKNSNLPYLLVNKKEKALLEVIPHIVKYGSLNQAGFSVPEGPAAECKKLTEKSR